MISVSDLESSVLVVSEHGYGKRSAIEDYRITNRGGKGVKTINITPKTGSLISIRNVFDTDDLMIINKSGILIRMSMSDIRVMGRATQGVTLINLKANDTIAAVAKVERDIDADLDEKERGEIDPDTGINDVNSKTDIEPENGEDNGDQSMDDESNEA